MYYLQIKAILFGDLAVQVKQIDVFPNYRHGIALKEMTVHARDRISAIKPCPRAYY